MTDQHYAVVDYGTNSARLMIAVNTVSGIKTIKKTLDTIRLGDGMQDGRITDAAMARAKATTLRFLAEAERYNVDTFYCFATSAVRDAANASEFKAHLLKECGVSLDIISGDREARIGYIGASRGTKAPVGIIDIGGGSTEIVTGENGVVGYAHSFRTGTVRLLQQYADASPENQQAYASAVSHILEIFTSLPKDWAILTGWQSAERQPHWLQSTCHLKSMIRKKWTGMFSLCRASVKSAHRFNRSP